MPEGKHPDNLALDNLIDALNVLRDCKPEERSELSRRYAIAITELEKVVAYVEVFIVNRDYYLGEELASS